MWRFAPRLYMVAGPVLAVAVLQLSGCTPGPAGTPPPGGTYLSTSAGAHFDQSVKLAGEDGTIAGYPLQRAHRPAHDPARIYIAAGERGIVFSTNGGEDWQRIIVPLAFVYDVVVLPNEVMVAAGRDEQGQGYIVRSLDAGKSWESVLTIPVPVQTKQYQIIKQPTIATVILSLEADPFHADRLYAGNNLGTILIGEQSAKVWRTAFTLNGPGFDPLNNQQRLAIADIIPSPHRADELLLLTTKNTVLRLTGQQQQAVTIPQYLSKPPPFGSANNRSRKVFDIIYIPGFANALLAATDKGAVVSQDNGQTWHELAIPVEAATDFNGAIVAVSPTNSARLIVAVNSVIYRSEDGGATWNTFNLGLPTHRVTAILIDPRNAGRVLVVTAPIKA